MWFFHRCWVETSDVVQFYNFDQRTITLRSMCSAYIYQAGSSRSARGAICPRQRCSRCLYVGNSPRSDVGVTVDLSPSHGLLFFYFDLKDIFEIYAHSLAAQIVDHFHHFFSPKTSRPRFLLGASIFNSTCKFYSKIKHTTHTTRGAKIKPSYT